MLPQKRLLPWLAIALATPILLILLASIGARFADSDAPRLALFAGRFHPALLHLPIGALAVAAVLELLARLRTQANFRPAVTATLFFSALTALPVALFGVLLSWSGGYDETLLERHLWLGALTVGLAFLLLGLRPRPEQARPSPAYTACLLVTLAALTIAGHYGGSLTHGSGYLTRYWPLQQDSSSDPLLASAAPSSPDQPEASVYQAHIQPIFADHCVQCHGPEKSKNDFRLDTFERLMASGDNAPALIPGDSYESLMVKQLKLPLEHEQHMPPEGKSQLTAGEIALISWWIDQGAKADATLEQLKPTPAIARLLGQDDGAVVAASTHIDAKRPAAELKPWTAIRNQISQINAQYPIEVLPLSRQDARLQLRATDPTSPAINDALDALAPLGPQIAWLDLGGCQLNPTGLQAIARMTGLERAHLQNTNLSDPDLATLSNLPRLHFLNLYGTSVSDQGLRHLESLPSLRRVYLWQTQATSAGIARLQDRLHDELQEAELQRQLAEIQAALQSLQVEIHAGQSDDLSQN